MSVDDDRLAGLARTKLEGLVRRAFPAVTEAAASFPAGAGIQSGDAAYVYLVKPEPSPLAAALAWGTRMGATDLHVIVDDDDGLIGLQATGFEPPVQVWKAVGAELTELIPATMPDVPVPSEVDEHISLLLDAGCDIAGEHGVVVGEVLGLEVARIVLEADGATSVRVGVGLYDQEAHALVHAGESVEGRLDQVVTEVRRHRRAGAAPHPINRVARQRWLRAIVLAEPGIVGLETASALTPLRPRGGIHEEGPVAAAGVSNGRGEIVVTAVGIDLDAVPCAAGHLVRDGGDAVRIVMPERDHHDVIRRQAARLAVPAELMAITEPWA